MKKIAVVAAFLIMALSPGMSIASEITDASLSKLLALCGITKQVSQFPGLLQVGLERARQQDRARNKKPALSESEYDELGQTMAGAFKPAGILQVIAREVRRTTSEEDARKMLSWYESDPGKRITKAEEDASTPEAYQKMVASAKSLMADKKHVQFVKKLDRLLHMTDSVLKLQEHVAVAMVVGFSTALKPDRPVNLREVRASISKALQKARPNIEQTVILSSVYTYKDIDQDSLDKYLAFTGTERALKFNRSLMDGMDAGIAQATRRMAKSIATLARKNHGLKS